MVQEIQALKDHNTRKLVNPTEAKQKLFDCKWVCKRKAGKKSDERTSKGTLGGEGVSALTRYRLQWDVWTSRKIIFHTSLIGWRPRTRTRCESNRRENAFLNTQADEEIYMSQLEGFVDNRRQNYDCQLERTLYCLNQAARGFYNTLCSALE